MVSTSLEYYKPTKRAWIAVSILGLCIVAIVYAVCSSNVRVKVGTSFGLEAETGNASQDVHFHVQQKVGI